MKFNLLVYFFFIITLISCTDTSERKSKDAYIRGHIVNPTSKYIVFSRDSTLVDTVYLNSENEFSWRAENVQKGLYNFQHSYENQVLYLAPGDSLLVWANTLEFDETLHFSGIGAEKNNFIVNLFLLNEENTDLVLDYYKIEPRRFEEITDSIISRRLVMLDSLVEEKEISEDFIEVAEKMIEYEFNNLRERYTYLINKYYPEFSDNFPQGFYDYRKTISFNEKTFQTNPDYLRFLDNHLINLSMQDCDGDSMVDPCYDQSDYQNIIKRINLVDSLIDLPLVRNYMFEHLGTTGMIMGENREELSAILNSFKDKGYPREDFIDLVTLGNIQLAFIPGINIGSVPVITSEGDTTKTTKLISNNTMIYLWSIYAPNHHKEQHRKIRELREKYPEVDFVGINIDIDETSAWMNALQKYNYSMENEYQLDKIQILGRYVKSDVFKPYLAKLLFLDSSGTVVWGKAQLDSPQFESDLLEFLNP